MLLRDLHASGERLLAALDAGDTGAIGACLEERAALRERVQQAGAFTDQPGYAEWGVRVVQQHRRIDRTLAGSLLDVERRQANLERAQVAQRRYVPRPSGGILTEGLSA